MNWHGLIDRNLFHQRLTHIIHAKSMARFHTPPKKLSAGYKTLPYEGKSA